MKTRIATRIVAALASFMITWTLFSGVISLADVPAAQTAARTVAATTG
jgi:hypothetical protein